MTQLRRVLAGGVHDAACVGDFLVAGAGKALQWLGFPWIDRVLGDPKIALDGVYRAFHDGQYARVVAFPCD